DFILEGTDARVPALEGASAQAPLGSPAQRRAQEPPLPAQRVGREGYEDERARNDAVARITQDLREMEVCEQRRRAAEDEERDREHVEDVLDRDSREAGGEGHARAARERGLRR